MGSYRRKIIIYIFPCMNVYRAAVVAGRGDSTRTAVQRHHFCKLRLCLPADTSPSPFASVPRSAKTCKKW